jgi:HEAT repeat protein
MMLPEVIKIGLMSNDTKKVLKALDSCILNFKVLIMDSEAFEIVYLLLGHLEYKIRQKTELMLKFLIQNNPDQVNLYYDHINAVFSYKEFNNEIWFRLSRLLAFISRRSKLQIQVLLEILSSQGYPQNLVVFILREIDETDTKLLVNELFKLLSSENESKEILDSYISNKDYKTNLKKAICWIFWQNSRLISLETLELLSFFTNDEDREVRRLSCEILALFLNDEKYQTAIIEIFVDRLFDSSRRVQRIAIENLLSIEPNLPQEKLFFIDRILNLFSHEDWEIRKNICESIPPKTLFYQHDIKTNPFLKNLVMMLNDPRWEIRETAIISLNLHLSLEKKENNEILIKVFGLMDDTHEQVRKTCCHVISNNINVNQNLKTQFIKKIIDLITDMSPFVRQEALECLSTAFTDRKWSSILPDIFDNLFRVLDDNDKNVRAGAWELLNKLTEIFPKHNFQRVIEKIMTLFDSTDLEIRYFAVIFLKNFLSISRTPNSLIYTKPYISMWKKKFVVLLKDEDQKISEIAWKLVLENKTTFVNMRNDLRKIFLDLDNLSPQICRYSCEICVEFDWIQTDASIRDILMNLLCKTNNREVRKNILRAFLPFKDKFYLNSQILFQLIQDGQWDVQERVCQFLTPFLLENIGSPEFYEILDIITNLLMDPVKESFSSSSNEAISINTLTKDVENILSENNFPSFFDRLNDDLRFQKWIQLEEKFDLIKKINHPNSSMISERFDTLIMNELKRLDRDLGYHELLEEKSGLNTPVKIISLMRKQQEFVRLSLLHNIETTIDFSQKKVDRLRKAIIYSLDDISLKIRNISWNILRNKIIPVSGLEKNLESILQLTKSVNSDTRIRAISILINQISLKKFESEHILNHLINLLDDHCYLVRIQIWSIIENEINVSYPRYNYIVRKILTLVSNSNVKIRKEAEKFIEQNLTVFLPVIENYPQSSNILHLLGKIYGKGEDYEKAIQFFFQIIEDNPLDINSWLAIALVNILRRNFNEVFRILKKIQQEIDQFDYRTYLIWSECLLEMGNQSEANKMKEIARLLR